MLARRAVIEALEAAFRRAPVVALLGPRQVGKTTLALEFAWRARGPTTRFDLEDPRDLARLDEPVAALERLRGLVVLDEIQRLPDIFPVLRVLADRPGEPAPPRGPCKRCRSCRNCRPSSPYSAPRSLQTLQVLSYQT